MKIVKRKILILLMTFALIFGSFSTIPNNISTVNAASSAIIQSSENEANIDYSNKYAYAYTMSLNDFNPILFVITTNNVTRNNRSIGKKSGTLTFKRVPDTFYTMVQGGSDNSGMLYLLNQSGNFNQNGGIYYYASFQSDDAICHIFIPKSVFVNLSSKANNVRLTNMYPGGLTSANAVTADNTSITNCKNEILKNPMIFTRTLTQPKNVYEKLHNKSATSATNVASSTVTNVTIDQNGYSQIATLSLKGTCCGITLDTVLDFKSVAGAPAIITNCTDIKTGSTSIENLFYSQNSGVGKTNIKLARNKTNHKNIVTDKAVAATCTAAGKTEGKHCSGCNTVTVAQTTIPAKGHTWNNGSVTQQPTCTAKGIKLFTCTTCKDTKTEDIPATGHTSVTDKAVAATCTKDGKTEGSHCSKCNAVLVAQKTVPAKGHTWDAGQIAKQPTCTEVGIKLFTCTTCKETKTESIASTGHIETKVHTDPTCTKDGSDVVKCKKCNEIIKTTILPATGHKWDAGKVTKKVTVKEDGIITYTCTTCKITRTETVPRSNAINEALNNIPLPENESEISEKDKKEIEELRNAIDSLTAEQKKNVNSDLLKKLEALEKKIEELNKKDTKTTEKATETKKEKTKEEKVSSAIIDKNGLINGQTVYEFKKDNVNYKIEKTPNGYSVYYYDNAQGWIKIPNSSSSSSSYYYTITNNSDGTKTVVINKSTKVAKPKKVSIKSFKSTKKKAATVKFKKVKNVKGYQVKISTSINFTKKTTKTKNIASSKAACTFNKLKSKKVYYVKIRAYKKVNGKKVYGNWSKIRKVKVK